MKIKITHILALLAIAIAALYIFRKKSSGNVAAPASSGSDTSAIPGRIQLINQMDGYIDKLYVENDTLNTSVSTWNDNVKEYKETAKEWARGMYDWCYDNENGWSFADQQAKADKNGYPLALQMVQSIAWQLYNKGDYNNIAYKHLENHIYRLAQ